MKKKRRANWVEWDDQKVGMISPRGTPRGQKGNQKGHY